MNCESVYDSYKFPDTIQVEKKVDPNSISFIYGTSSKIKDGDDKLIIKQDSIFLNKNVGEYLKSKKIEINGKIILVDKYLAGYIYIYINRELGLLVSSMVKSNTVCSYYVDGTSKLPTAIINDKTFFYRIS